jgi:outer membrane scaffolding protein for murein synthesis (MipA/OmpV family)
VRKRLSHLCLSTLGLTGVSLAHAENIYMFSLATVFSPRWSVHTEAGASRLIGNSGDSPIVQKKVNYFAISALTYRY